MRVNFASFLPNPHKKKKKCFHLAAQTGVLKSAPKTRISGFVWSQMYHLYREATHNLGGPVGTGEVELTKKIYIYIGSIV